LHKNNGLIIYHFHHEGRGFGFTSKLRSLKTESPIDSIIEMHSEIDHRRYYSTIKILQDLQISKVYLMTNNPAKQLILESQNIKVVKRIPLITKQKHLQEYLKTKQDRLGNIINKHDHKNH
jgi:GTP cyclohydrolase II